MKEDYDCVLSIRSQTCQRRSRYELVTNADKAAAKKKKKTVSVAQATMLRRTAPPARGSQCLLPKKRSARPSTSQGPHKVAEVEGAARQPVRWNPRCQRSCRQLWGECAVCSSVQPDVVTKVKTPFCLRLEGPAKVYASAVLTR